MRTGKIALVSLLSGILVACASGRPPLKPVDYVELERFMGDWYVIASIPTIFERDIYNAVESYHLNSDGTIATKFTFRKGSFDGETKVYRPKGYVRDPTSNAVWRMQLIWPIEADYRIIHLSPDYRQTVVGRNKRDYVWIMARSPTIPQADYEAIVERLADVHYDVSKIKRVPQRWP